MHVALAQRRDPVRAGLLRVSLRADAEPAGVDQAHRDRRDALPVERLVIQVLGGRSPQLGQTLGEADQPVELRLLLLRAEIGVVEVLPPTGSVDAGRLQLRARARRDPDVLPRGRNHQRANSLELLFLADRITARIEITEMPV